MLFSEEYRSLGEERNGNNGRIRKEEGGEG